MKKSQNETWVGIFMLLALLATLFICFKTSDITSMHKKSTYRIYAIFDNVGNLKIRSPVRIGGVVVGRVSSISLDEKTYLPCVTIDIEKRYNHIPNTSSISVYTSGLLGEQNLAFNIGFEDPKLGTDIIKDGDVIRNTKSALVLEDMIGQLIYSDKNNNRNS